MECLQNFPSQIQHGTSPSGLFLGTVSPFPCKQQMFSEIIPVKAHNRGAILCL